LASEDGPRERIDVESLDLGDMARHARAATFASNWKSVLAVDASLGIVVLLIGLAVVAWVGWAGWILAVAGAIYVGLVGRRFLQWRWIRSQAGLD